jgi:hypothetical protein
MAMRKAGWSRAALKFPGGAMNPFLAAVLVLLAGTGAGGAESPRPWIRDFLGSAPRFDGGPLVSTGQYSDESVYEPARRNDGLRLFPGPVLLSVSFGASAVPIVGGGAADDSSPHLAPYRSYWSFGGGLQAEVHLHVLPTADAYAAIGIVHHSSTGAKDWSTWLGSSTVRIRYRFNALTLVPVEFGGKGYLKLKAPPGLRFIDPGRRAPMAYVRFGAGPVFVAETGFQFDRWVDGVYQGSYEYVWWPGQSVLGVHAALGFEFGDLRGAKGGTGLGLFIEAGYRYISAPVVSKFTDTSDPIQSLVFTLGVHLP